MAHDKEVEQTIELFYIYTLITVSFIKKLINARELFQLLCSHVTTARIIILCRKWKRRSREKYLNRLNKWHEKEKAVDPIRISKN